MLRAHRIWATTGDGPALHGVHSARTWGEGIVQAYCERCEKNATAVCVKEHGAGLYACMDPDHVAYYATLVRAHAPTRQGAVWCWGAQRQEGMHVWSQYAMPESIITSAMLPGQVPTAHASTRPRR